MKSLFPFVGLIAYLLISPLLSIAQTRITNIYDKPLQRAVIDAATSGNNTLVAANASGRICVLGMLLVSAGDVTARLEDGAGGTALSGQMDLENGGGFMLPQGYDCWFLGSKNTLLNLELSGAVSVDGVLLYAIVP